MRLRDLMNQAKPQEGEATTGKTKLEEARARLQDQLQGKLAAAKIQAAEISVTGKQRLEETRDKLQVAMDEAQRKAEEIAHRAAALIPQVIELEPILKELGFAVCNINVTLSIAPGIAIIIEQQIPNVQGGLESALKTGQYVLTDFQSRLLGLLAKATDFAAQMTYKYGYRAQQYELTLLPPSVIVHFAPHSFAAAPTTMDTALDEPGQADTESQLSSTDGVLSDSPACVEEIQEAPHPGPEEIG
jgi:ElaB/YqjD/DUF883 family membrane-anchored ribosome-binding protein